MVEDNPKSARFKRSTPAAILCPSYRRSASSLREYSHSKVIASLAWRKSVIGAEVESCVEVTSLDNEYAYPIVKT